MATWLLFALLSPAIVALVIFIDKYLLEKAVKDYRGMPIYGAIMAFIFGTLFWIGTNFPLIPANEALFVLMSGVLTIWASALYFKVLADEEASKVIILIQLIPVIVLILSVLFLKETISLQQFIGFVLILTATVGVTIKNDTPQLKISSALFIMLLASCGWALASVLFKFGVHNNTFLEVVSVESWGITIGGIILYVVFPSIRTAFIKTTKTVKRQTLLLLFTNEGLFIASKLCGFLAISLGSVSLVSVIGSTSVFFGILYGIVAMFFFPKIFQEDITKKGLLHKLILALIVFLGLVLIN